MASELQPYAPPPYDNRPNWGVIILTGIAALVLVISAGMLLRQAGDALEDAAIADPTATRIFVPTATPSPTPTPLPAAAALPLIPTGEWEITVALLLPDGTVEEFTSSGTGAEITEPEYTVPPGVQTRRVEMYRIILNYPISANLSETEVIDYWLFSAYVNALNSPFYMLYDANDQPMQIVNAATFNSLYNQLTIKATPDQ